MNRKFKAGIGGNFIYVIKVTIMCYCYVLYIASFITCCTTMRSLPLSYAIGSYLDPILQ